MRNKIVALPLYLLLSLYCLQVVQNPRFRLYYRLYEWLWIVVFSCSQTGYIVWRISLKNPPVMQIPATLYDVLLLLCNLSISTVLLKNRSKLDGLLHAMKCLTKNTQRKGSREGVFAVVLIAAAFVVIFLRSMLLLSNLKPSNILEMCVTFISVWLVQRLEILLVGICWIAWELQLYHGHFNKKLQQIQGFDSLRPHLQVYNRLCRAVSDFNDLFGYPIMFSVFTILCLALGILSKMVSSDAYIYERLDTTEVVRRLVYLAPYLSYIIALSVLGEQLRRDVRKTIEICFSYSEKSEISYVIGHVSQTKEKLLVLANQVFQRSTTLNAAGFFSLDSSTILFLVNTFCTYLVAICQFMLGKH